MRPLLFFPLLVVSTHAYILSQYDRYESLLQRSVRIRNKSGRRLEAYWVNNLDPNQPETFVAQSLDGEGILYGADCSISSYAGHEFEIRELPGKTSGTCLETNCWSGRFVVSMQQKQEVIVDKSFTITYSDTHQKAKEDTTKLIDECERKAEAEGYLSGLQMIDFISSCVKHETFEELAKKHEEAAFQSKMSSQMATDLVPFACGDINYTESLEMVNSTWEFSGDDDRKEYIIRIHHNRPTSMIIEIRDFATKDECEAVEKFENDDGKVMFENIDGVDSDEDIGPSLHNIVDKFYELAGKFMDWQDLNFKDMIRLDETLFYRHRDTRGMIVSEKECTPDDVIEGEQVPSSCKLPGQIPVPVHTEEFNIKEDEEEWPGSVRVATAYLFCNEPLNKQLGGLHFSYAGVHIEPRPRTAIFAIHKHVKDEYYDGFVQDYHFCPNHDLYTHSFYGQPVKVETHLDEGEL